MRETPTRSGRPSCRSSRRQRRRRQLCPELGKADSRVKDDLLWVHPLVDQAPQPSGQFSADIYSDVVVVCTGLHVAARPPRVHENVGHPGERDQRWHGRVTEAAAHVVDDACPCVEGGLGDAGPGGIDTDWDTGLRELADHRQHALQLGAGRDTCSARPCRLATHINQVSTVSGHREAVVHRAFRSQVRTPVGERIRRDVEYAHDTASSCLLVRRRSPTRAVRSRAGPRARRGVVTAVTPAEPARR